MLLHAALSLVFASGPVNPLVSDTKRPFGTVPGRQVSLRPVRHLSHSITHGWFKLLLLSTFHCHDFPAVTVVDARDV
jgi:hypothetical protein